DHRETRCLAVDQRAHRFVRAGRILDQEHQYPPVADLDPFEAPECRPEALEPCRDLVERNTQHTCERRRGERVVDVVEAGNAEAYAPRPFRRDEVERDVLETAARDLTRDDL